MTPNEVLIKARANCLRSIRIHRGYLHAEEAITLAEETVVRALRGRPVTRQGRLVRFAVEDCVDALRAADDRVAEFLTA